MQFPEVVVGSLKWLSQFIVFLSATSAMFQDLYTVNPATARRRLTRSGWVHLAGLLTGFIVFGVTEIRDHQKAAQDRVDAARREAQQTAQVQSLKSVLVKQEGIESGLRTQIEQGKAIQKAQDTVIHVQDSQNARLKDLMLASYQLSGIEVTLDAPSLQHSRFATLFQAVKDDLKSSGQTQPAQFDLYWQYFETCLEHGEYQAVKGERDQWEIGCRLLRPQGIASPTLYCPPDTYQWRVFEGLLEVLFGRVFRIQIAGGPDLVVVNSGTRPASVERKGEQLKLTVVGTRVKIAQLAAGKVALSIDKPSSPRAELFRSIRIRSLDPLVQFDTTITPAWQPTKIGTQKVWLNADDEPQDVDVIVQAAGPISLPIRFDPRLMNAEIRP